MLYNVVITFEFGYTRRETKLQEHTPSLRAISITASCCLCNPLMNFKVYLNSSLSSAIKSIFITFRGFHTFVNHYYQVFAVLLQSVFKRKIVKGTDTQTMKCSFLGIQN